MFHFELVTPERVLFQEEIDAVTLPTTEGEITILNHHIPLVASLVPGIAKIKRTHQTEEIAVSGGFIEVDRLNKVRVLADAAERGHELDLSVIEQAKERAKAAMAEAVRTNDVSYAAAAAALEHELARYRVARKHLTSVHTPTVDSANIPHDRNPI